MDLHYFNSKKINTLKSAGIDYKSNGTIRPIVPENSAITMSELLKIIRSMEWRHLMSLTRSY
jgi:hypothetical protein